MGLNAAIGDYTASPTRGIKIVASDEGGSRLEEIELYDRVHAVIIGIDRYPNLPPNRQLSYAVSDAKKMERMLRSRFVVHEIHTLYDNDATRDGILNLLYGTLSKVSKKDGIFFFYAGHGGQETTDYGDFGYIVPHNGSFDDPARNISMTLIKEDISKKIPAKHIFYVMDACYGGLLLETRGGEKEGTKRDLAYLKRIAGEPVRQVLTAGSSNEQVLDRGPYDSSVFTGRLLQAMEEADDFITASELSTQVMERVFSDARTRGHTQTPQHGRLFGRGDFVFMPSSRKKLTSIQDEIKALEANLARLDTFLASAEETEKKAEMQRAEREQAAARAKLEARKLEEARLLEQQNKLRAKQEQARQEEESRRNKEAMEEERLAKLREVVSEKRKTARTSMTSSLESTVAELGRVNADLMEIRGQYRDELKKRILAQLEEHKQGYDPSTFVKDEFETQAEYEARVAKATGNQSAENRRAFGNIANTVSKEYYAMTDPLMDQMVQMGQSTFDVIGRNETTISLGTYVAEREVFPVTVASTSAAPFPFKVKSDLKVPRSGARQFKQNYLNGFMVAEVRLQPATEKAVVPVGAKIVDESQDRRYELFEARFIDLGNSMVYDTQQKIVWLTRKSNKNIGNEAAKKYCDTMDHMGIRGWRLPKNSEIKNLKDPLTKRTYKLVTGGMEKPCFYYSTVRSSPA